MSINLQNINSKFYPNLLGHEQCPAKDLKDEMDAIFKDFSNRAVDIKQGYIFDTGTRILKVERRLTPLVPETTPDTHIYRVRKAEKIQKYIVSQNLQNDIVVPKKYIYWCEKENRFYVVSEKVALSNEVAKPAGLFKAQQITMAANEFGGQAQAFTQGSPQRDLTANQAKALAELAFSSGYTDQNYNNVFFTADGKVAILDTEPVQRFERKKILNNIFFKVFGDKTALKTIYSISGTAKMKLYCNAEALKEVNEVEKKHVLWRAATMVGKIALGALAISAAALALPLLPIGVAAITALQAVTITLLALKTISELVQMLSLLGIWKISRMQGEANVF